MIESKKANPYDIEKSTLSEILGFVTNLIKRGNSKKDT